MFTVIYSFEVKECKVDQFINGWEGLTKLIYEFEGSLGSRLHKVDTLNYIAYAQWPSKEKFDNAGSNLPESAVFFRSEMKESCVKIETSHEMEVVSDLLKTKVFG
jgi:heme-degrading monooxygenase HmoA